MLCTHPWQKTDHARSPFNRENNRAKVSQSPGPVAPQNSPPGTKTAMLMDLLDSQPEDLASLDKYTVVKPVKITPEVPSPLEDAPCESTELLSQLEKVRRSTNIRTIVSSQDTSLQDKQDIISQILFSAWEDSRGTQKPLHGCRPYTFQLPLAHLHWDLCIGGPRELEAINRIIDSNLVVVEQRSCSRTQWSQTTDLQPGSEDQVCDKELVVLPADPAGFISEPDWSKEITQFRLDQIYDLCFSGYHRELLRKKENIRLVVFLREQFGMMQRVLRMSRTEDGGS